MRSTPTSRILLTWSASSIRPIRTRSSMCSTSTATASRSAKAVGNKENGAGGAPAPFVFQLLLTHQRVALRDEARTSIAVVPDVARDQIHHGTSGRQRLLLIFD